MNEKTALKSILNLQNKFKSVNLFKILHSEIKEWESGESISSEMIQQCFLNQNISIQESGFLIPYENFVFEFVGSSSLKYAKWISETALEIIKSITSFEDVSISSLLIDHKSTSSLHKLLMSKLL